VRPTGGVPSRKMLYAEAAKYAIPAINVLVEEMSKPTKMSGSRVAAAKTILAKSLPDLKAVEVTGEDGKAPVFKLVIEDGYGDKYRTVRTIPAETAGSTKDAL